MLIFLLVIVTVHHGSTSSSKLKASGGLFEGDIMLNKFQRRSLAFGPRNGVTFKRYRWPKNKSGLVMVNYKFKDPKEYCESLINVNVAQLYHHSHDFSADQEKSTIRSALNGIEDVSCIRFEESNSANDVIGIFNGDSCYSKIGRQGGAQILSLNKQTCIRRKAIQHEVLHSLGASIDIKFAFIQLFS